jgi:hypothetical protein
MHAGVQMNPAQANCISKSVFRVGIALVCLCSVGCGRRNESPQPQPTLKYGTLTQTETRTLPDTQTETFTQTTTTTGTDTITVTTSATHTELGTGTHSTIETVTNTDNRTATDAYNNITATVTGTVKLTAYYVSWTGGSTSTHTASVSGPVQGATIVATSATATKTNSRNSIQTTTVTSATTGFVTFTGTAVVTATNTNTSTSGTRAGSGTRTVTATGTSVGTGSVLWAWQETSTRTQTAVAPDTVVVTDTGTGTATAPPTAVSTQTRTFATSKTTTVTTTASNTSTSEAYISMSFPSGVEMGTIVGAANDSIQMGDRSVTSSPEGGAAAISNAGGGQVNVGVNSQIGSVTSVGSVVLRERAHIQGDLTTGGVPSYQNATQVTGSITANATLTPLSVTGWHTDMPAANLGDILLYSGSSITLNPGSYAEIRAYSGASVSLATGTYYATTFDMEPESTLRLDTSAGPIVVYVTGTIIFRGSIVQDTGPEGALMLAELGDADVFVERAFSGTIVAPYAGLTLGSTVPMTMRGWFYGQRLVVRPDTTLIKVMFPWDTVLKPKSPGYCPDDTDNDGTPDCSDECPYNPNKTKPGACGCQRPDYDFDNDGLPDCLDPCPADPDRTSMGQCGCKDRPGLKPAGTPCTDTACPQPAGSTCNGLGSCGSDSVCPPGPDCKLITWQGSAYWFCGIWSPAGRLSRDDAKDSCANKGMALVRVDSADENRFIRNLLTAPVWMGANDLTTEGVWQWARPTSDSGSQFWSGGPTGARLGSLYTNWAPNSPAVGRCGLMNNVDGRWVDANCDTVLGYVCEHNPSPRPASPPPIRGLPDSGAPMPPTCVPDNDESVPQLPLPVGDPPSDAAVVAAQELLKQQIALVDAGQFQGAASNPPSPGSTCPSADPASSAIGSEPGVGCQVTDKQGVPNGCDTDSDCSAFGPSYVCRETPPPEPCTPQGIPPLCPVYRYCVILDCPQPDNSLPCDEINICNPGSENDAGLDPDASNVAPVALNPGDLFGGNPPDAAPTAAYVDNPPPPNSDAGVNHPWCRMITQNPLSVPQASQPGTNQRASTKSGATLSLDFDPNLVFEIDAKPLALGENNMRVHAQASLAARVKLSNFMGKDFGPADILNAAVDLEAKRCSISTANTHLQILGQHVDLKALGVPIFDTSVPNSDPEDDPDNDLFKVSQACTNAIQDYQIAAGRVKKAFRDAQQLLVQYHNLDKLLSSNLCQILDGLAATGADIASFPGGATCYPNESVEETINRFADYYQAPGIGQLAKLKNAGGTLSSVSAEISKVINRTIKKAVFGEDEDLKIEFLNKSHQETQTIVNVPFAIGPVPCVLQIDLSTSFGVKGNFALELNFPLNLDSKPGDKSKIAHASANVVPYASAALSAFVGAGVDYGAFSATLGLEGRVYLADAQAPLFVGAGVDMEVLDDFRPIPDDVKPPISIAANAFHLGVPKAFKFSASYDYGMRLDVTKVLDGELNARLRIKFCFFSRTWRKRVIKFNGFQFHYDLIKGGSSLDVQIGGRNPGDSHSTVPAPAEGAPDNGVTTVASGNTTMGLSETEVPLMQLAYLPTPNQGFGGGGHSPDGGAPSKQIDLTQLGSLFYDIQCCAKAGESCKVDKTPYPACCPHSTCVVPDAGTSGTCVGDCRGEGENCQSDGDCCPRQNLVCGTFGTCRACGSTNAPCTSNSDCCNKWCDTAGGTFKCLEWIP